MVTKIIDHPFRTITLQFDETKAGDGAFEQEMVSALVEYHDVLHGIFGPAGDLLLRFEGLTDSAEKAKATLLGFESTMQDLQNETTFVASQKDDDDAFQELSDKLLEFTTTLQSFHAETVATLFKEGISLYGEYLELSHRKRTDEEGMRNWFEAKIRSGEMDGQLLSLDWDGFMAQHALMLEEAKNKELSFQLIWKNKMELDVFKEMVDNVFQHWSKLSASHHAIFDNENSYDKSLSESYRLETGDPALKPVYVLQPDDPRVLNYKTKFPTLGYTKSKTILIEIDAEAIKSRDVYFVQEMILGLQHYPKLLEKIIFSIQMVHKAPDGSVLPEEKWKGSRRTLSWYSRLLDMPCSIFFFEDRDARNFILFGDIMSEGLIRPDSEGVFTFRGKSLETLRARLFNACWFFMLFCHNTGVDAEPYVHAILADFDLPVTFEDIKEAYLKDIRSGVKLKSRPTRK